MATADKRAARERKQKIFVAVGGLLLLALLAIQLPKLMGGSDSSAASSTTTVESTTATGELAPPADSAVPVTVALTDTDRPVAPGPGQLRSFGTFTRKDPFVQQLVPPATDEGTGGSEGGAAPGGGAGAGAKSGTTPSKGFSVGDSSAASVTVIAVNGARQPLSPGTAFPAADPVFVLVAEQSGAKTVVIGVAGGAYANGDNTTKLKVGKPLVLVNTATGARYRLVLVAVGNGSATAPTTPPPAGGTDGNATTP